MRIYEYGRPNFSVPTGKRVMALGLFDGVHIGHRALLDTAKERALDDGVPLSVFTFRSESAELKKGERLYSTEDKLSLLKERGVDEVILADFITMKNLCAEDFVNEFLIQKCGCSVAVTGRDFRFGDGAAGNVELLSSLMKSAGRDVITVGDVTRFGVKVSTTAIKDYLAKGDTESANAMLGTPYFIGATVEHGRGVGRTLGFPTLNCDMAEKMGILRHGVYLSVAEIGGEQYKALTNVGTCPTFEERVEHAEAFLLDFNGEIYGERVKISLLKFMREERRFSDADELTKQVREDTEKAKKEFYKVWQETGLS